MGRREDLEDYVGRQMLKGRARKEGTQRDMRGGEIQLLWGKSSPKGNRKAGEININKSE